VVADPDSLRTQLQKHGDRLRDADDRRREEHEAIAQLVPAALDETLEFFREVRRIDWEEPILLDQFRSARTRWRLRARASRRCG
jgi:hypothetical protein